jgi:chromosome segregation ATPase
MNLKVFTVTVLSLGVLAISGAFSPLMADLQSALLKNKTPLLSVSSDISDNRHPSIAQQDSPSAVNTVLNEAALQPIISQDEFLSLKSQVAHKDRLIERLSRHLESALVRLNRANTPLSSSNSSVAALSKAKAQLEKENNTLRDKVSNLEAQLAEVSKKKQLLDLENRQMFQALNGRPYSDERDRTDRTAKQNKQGDDKPLEFGLGR